MYFYITRGLAGSQGDVTVEVDVETALKKGPGALCALLRAPDCLCPLDIPRGCHVAASGFTLYLSPTLPLLRQILRTLQFLIGV